MGTFRVPVEIANIAGGGPFERVEALVDTGATYTLLPEEILHRLGVEPRGKRRFLLADNREAMYPTAWVLAKLYRGHHKGFVVYGDFWRPVIEAVEKNLLIRDEEKGLFTVVTSKEEILQAIEEFEKQMSKLDHAHCQVCKERAFMT